MSLPLHPLVSYDAKGHLVMAVHTNLPAGMRGLSTWAHVYGQGTASTSGISSPVSAGTMLAFVPRYCGVYPLELDVPPQWIHSEPPGANPPPLQPPFVYARFGQNFQKLTGPQVVNNGSYRQIVAKAPYFIDTTAGCKVPASNTLGVLSDPGLKMPPPSSGYEIGMPYAPKVHRDLFNNPVFDVPTNLPNATLVEGWWLVQGSHLSSGISSVRFSPFNAMSDKGVLSFPVPPTCARLRLVLVASPEPAFTIGGAIQSSSKPIQAASVTKVLGPNFERLFGSNVKSGRWNGTSYKELVATHTYFVSGQQGCQAIASGPEPAILLP